MKILLAQNMLYVPSLGGANTTTRILMEGLARRGHACRLLAPAVVGSYGPQTREQFLHNLAIRRISLASSNEEADLFTHEGVEIHAVADAARLRGYVAGQIREFNPEWVIVPSQDPGQVLLEAVLQGSPDRVIYLVVAAWDLPFGPGCVFASEAGTEMVRRAALVISISDFLRGYIKRWSGLESKVIHFPVYGSAPFPRLGSFDNEFVTLVNPSAIKGIDIFLDLARKLPEVKFAGVPTWATTVENRAALEQLPNVTLLNPVDDIDEIFTRTRALLVPSMCNEAFGNIVVEAMLRGIPVLASNVGGLPESKLDVDYVLPVRPFERYEERFDERNCPIPVIPTQDVTPWVNALRELLSDRKRYEELAVASLSAALNFVTRIEGAHWDDFLTGQRPKYTQPRADERLHEKGKTAAPDLSEHLSKQKRALLAFRALQSKKRTQDPL